MSKAIELLEKGDAGAKNWMQKLDLVWKVLQQIDLEPNELAALGGYLHLINNNQIVCEEDGGHHRPNHHAELALSIHTFLVEKLNKENSFLVKTILKNLPSFSGKFRSDVPLTRIRDIAHRNDIPHVAHFSN
jgi:phosphoglucan,water dikinase